MKQYFIYTIKRINFKIKKIIFIMRSNCMLEDHQIRQNNKTDNLRINVSILLLLFVTVMVCFVITILGNYFYIMNQKNIDKEIVTEHLK